MCLVAACRRVLRAANPREKASILLGYDTPIVIESRASVEECHVLPSRPSKPALVDPKMMPSPKALGLTGLRLPLYLMHGLCHIELNAVDLYCDTVVRFSADQDPSFALDFLRVAKDEGRHLTLLLDRLNAMGSHYGALPAHDGLWDYR